MLERLMGVAGGVILAMGILILTVPAPNFGTLLVIIGAGYMGGLAGALVDHTR